MGVALFISPAISLVSLTERVEVVTVGTPPGKQEHPPGRPLEPCLEKVSHAHTHIRNFGRGLSATETNREQMQSCRHGLSRDKVLPSQWSAIFQMLVFTALLLLSNKEAKSQKLL